MHKINIDLKTNIIPQSRPRVAKTGHAYYTKDVQECRKLLDFYFRRIAADSGMIEKAEFIKMSGEIHVTHNRGDIDNYIKMITDSANKILYYDDKQIVLIDNLRLYRKSKEGRVNICFESMD